jgi:hypothetical protein
MCYIVLEVPMSIECLRMTSSTGDERECTDTAGNVKITFCIECMGSRYQPSTDNPQEKSMYYSQH